MQTKAPGRVVGVNRERIAGVDTARGLAVLGMFVAHLGLAHHSGLLSATGWFFLADGRPSALFAMLAGIGLVFMTRSAQDDPAQFSLQRSRIMRRALILYLLGYVLTFLGTPVAVILPSYAVLFVLAIPFLRMRIAGVLTAAVLVLAVGPPLLILSRHAITGEAGPVTGLSFLPGLAEVWSGYYPVITWLAYILVGVAVGKMNLRSAGTGALLLGVGTVVAAAAYGAGAWAEDAVGGTEGDITFDLVTIEPHTNTTPEMLGNAAFGVALLGLCLLAMTLTPLRVLAAPVNAVGAMSLTIYSLHIVYIAILGPDAVWYPTSNQPLIWLIAGSLAFALVWHVTLGQGPLERLLARVIQPAATAASHHDPAAGDQRGPMPGDRGPTPGDRHGPTPPDQSCPAPGTQHVPNPGERPGPTPDDQRGPTPGDQRSIQPHQDRPPAGPREPLPTDQRHFDQGQADQK